MKNITPFHLFEMAKYDENKTPKILFEFIKYLIGKENDIKNIINKNVNFLIEIKKYLPGSTSKNDYDVLLEKRFDEVIINDLLIDKYEIIKTTLIFTQNPKQILEIQYYIGEDDFKLQYDINYNKRSEKILKLVELENPEKFWNKLIKMIK
jgi:hypothetical protein